jgi:hypothetical protein
MQFSRLKDVFSLYGLVEGALDGMGGTETSTQLIGDYFCRIVREKRNQTDEEGNVRTGFVKSIVCRSEINIEMDNLIQIDGVDYEIDDIDINRSHREQEVLLLKVGK